MPAAVRRPSDARRLLGAVIASLLGAGLLSLSIVSSDAGPPIGSDADVAAHDLGGSGTPPTIADGGGSSAGREAPPTSQRADSPGAINVVTDGAKRPPAPEPGQYAMTYRYSDPGQVDREGTTELTITEGQEGTSEETRQVHSFRDPYATHLTGLAWRPDGVYWVSDGRRSPPEAIAGNGNCDINPAVPLIAFPLSAGNEWEAESRCVHSQDPDNDDRDLPPQTVSLRGRVSGSKDITFRGAVFSAFSVALAVRTIQPSSNSRPGYTRTEQRQLLYVPTIGLTVREHISFTTEYDGAGTYSSRGIPSQRRFELVGLE